MAADAPERPVGTDSGGGNSHDRARVVRRYLSALDAQKPGRTTARTAESVQHRMHQIDTLLLSADPVQKLHLTQERIDLHTEHLRLTTSANGDFAELERSFVRVARSYGDRHGLTYSAWRQIGVAADVLAKAGIKPHVKPARALPAAEPEPKKYKPTATAAEPAPAPAKAEAEAEAKTAPEKTAPTKKAAAPKKVGAKKAAAPTNGSAPRTTKKAAAKSPAGPEQQRLPAEAHLLS